MEQRNPISFPEHTCWNEEDFRYVRKPVAFRIYSVGGKLGQFEGEFTADYGVWYHRDDDHLIHLLRDAVPAVAWEEMIYHRKWDHSGIDICEPEEDLLVARMEVRQYRGKRLDVIDHDLGSNVIRFADYCTSRLNSQPIDPDVDKMFADGR
jgi:hypothetical protein